jgi:cobalt-zinc-cadmium efflux system outer membrane protein
MSSRVYAVLSSAAILLALTYRGYAEPLTIDLPSAVARARERAPEAIMALARIGEARAQRVGAGVWFSTNTEVQVGAGARFGEVITPAIRGIATQRLEPGRRSARIAVADAEVERAKLLTELDLRKLSFQVANVFYEARFAELTVELERRNLEIVTRATEAAVRRRKAGELTDLNVNLARIALGRARSEVAAAEAARINAIGDLAALIGARPEDVITLVGDLRPAPITLAGLRSAVPGRLDVRATEAETRVALAEERLARASGLPDFGVLFAYELDTDDSIVLGGVLLTLPFWNRAQGDKAAARARRNIAEREHAALVGAASREVVDAFDAYTRAREAVDVFEAEVLPPLADSELLLQRAVDSGQLAVNDYILAHIEILVAKHEHLERQLYLAKAAAAARFAAGMTP